MEDQGWTSRSAKPKPALQRVTLPKIDIVNIPPRQWAYGHYLLFGRAAALAAVDGGGKGAMAVTMLLSFITGRALLGNRSGAMDPSLSSPTRMTPKSGIAASPPPASTTALTVMTCSTPSSSSFGPTTPASASVKLSRAGSCFPGQ